MHGNSMHGNQEIPVPPAVLRKQRAGGGTHKDTPLMHGAGKSDRSEVPEKAPNKGNRGGAGGKAADQGERHGRPRGPDTGPGKRDQGTTRRAGSRTKRQGTKVHNATASREHETIAGQLLSAEEASCAGSGSGNVERVGTGGGGPHRGSSRPGSSRGVPGAAVTSSLHCETGWAATVTRNRGSGR